MECLLTFALLVLHTREINVEFKVTTFVLYSNIW